MSNKSRQQLMAEAAKSAEVIKAEAATETGIIDVVKANRQAIYNTADKLLKFDGQYKMSVKVLSPDKTKTIGIHFQAIKGFGEKPADRAKRGSDAV